MIQTDNIYTQKYFSTHNSDCFSLFQGGSLGKGTAIRGSCDLDAVVFLREFRDMDDFLRKKDDVLEQIKYHLQQTNYCKRGDLRVNRVTAFFVNFELRVRQQWIAVDLLPAFDNIGRKGKLSTQD